MFSGEDDDDDMETGQPDRDTEDDDDDDEDEEEDELSDDGDSRVSSLVSRMKGAGLSFPKEPDFREIAEGMDDLGEDEDETDAEGESEEDSDKGEDEDEDEGRAAGVMTFSKQKVDEEVEKGNAVKNQLGMWSEQGGVGAQTYLKRLVVQSLNPPFFPLSLTPQLFGTCCSKGGSKCRRPW